MAIFNLNQSGNINIVEDIRSSAETVTSVSVAATATILAATNASRRSISFYNAGSSTVFVSEGTPTTSLYKFQLPPGFYFTPDGPDIYTGAYNAIVASGTCNVMVSQG